MYIIRMYDSHFTAESLKRKKYIYSQLQQILKQNLYSQMKLRRHAHP